MGLQADTIIGDFKITHLADAVEMLAWISTYVILLLKKKPKHLKSCMFPWGCSMHVQKKRL